MRRRRKQLPKRRTTKGDKELLDMVGRVIAKACKKYVMDETEATVVANVVQSALPKGAVINEIKRLEPDKYEVNTTIPCTEVEIKFVVGKG